MLLEPAASATSDAGRRQDMSNIECEPLLSQVLDDPMTQVLMLSDGVDPRQLHHLIKEARQRIAAADRDAPPTPPVSRRG